MNELEIYNGMELTKELLIVFANGDEPRARRMVQKAPRERLEWVALTLTSASVGTSTPHPFRLRQEVSCDSWRHDRGRSIRLATQGGGMTVILTAPRTKDHPQRAAAEEMNRQTPERSEEDQLSAHAWMVHRMRTRTA